MSGTTEQAVVKFEKVKMNWFRRFYNNLFPSIVYATLDKEPFTNHDMIMEVHWSDNQIVFYKGGCTVWYTYPMMKRCDTSMEMQLSNMWSYFLTHGSPYPTAHETKR